MHLSPLSSYRRFSGFLRFSYLVRVTITATFSCAMLNPAIAETSCKTKHHPWVGQLAPELERLAPQVPAQFLLGWIQVESGGKLTSTTSLNERGYFQLMPDESEQLSLDHKRLSTDSEYSIQGGTLLVELYAKAVESLGYSRSDPDFWRMVKFEHAIGSGAVAQLLKDMQLQQVSSRSWATIEQYVKDNQTRLKKLLGHDPVKWTQNVDEVFAQGSLLEKDWHESCPSGQSAKEAAESSAQVLATVDALYEKRLSKRACDPPVSDYPRWTGYPVQRCEYSDVGVSVRTYMLNASPKQLAEWTVTACQHAGAAALNVCANEVAKIILAASSGIFPIAGYIPEPASVVAPDRPGGLCFLFRDGVTTARGHGILGRQWMGRAGPATSLRILLHEQRSSLASHRRHAKNID